MKTTEQELSYHQQDDVIGFCGDYRHPYGCQDEAVAETPVETELAAMAAVVDAFETLDVVARQRVLRWACERYAAVGEQQ